MDTKRVSDERYFHQLHEIYKHKFRNLSFDVIISSDDNAFNFLRKHRDEIFPGTPVVFCGVNFFKGSDLEGHDLFTGVNEEADFKAGIEIALRLHPDTKGVVVINDTTTTGMKIHEKLMEIIPDYQDSVNFVLLEDIEIEKIQEKLQGLPPDNVVFYTSFYRDKSGTFFEYDESISLIAKGCNVPIYAAWDFYLGYGIVGGMLTSGYYQGEAAAKLALRILGGEMVTDIPVIKESPNRYMFDYSQLDRFGISLSKLPRGSIVINKPYSFYSVHKGLVWGVFASIAGLTFIIFILSINIFKRKKAEERLKEAHEKLEERVIERTKDLDRANKQLNLELTERKRAEEELKQSEERYRLLFENAGSAITYFDTEGKCVSANRRVIDSLGGRDIPGKSIYDIFPKEVADFHIQRFTKIMKEGKGGRFEDAFELPGGKRWFSSDIQLVIDEIGNTRGVQIISDDITERKQSEEALRQSENHYRSVVEGSIQGIVIAHARDSTIQFANQAVAEMFGYTSPDELVGKNLWETLVEPEEWPELQGREATLLSGKTIPIHPGWKAGSARCLGVLC
jgi:PAS domain S-box-containing protein